MDFIVPNFLFLFLPIFLILYLIAGARLRPALMLLASLVFFYWTQRASLPLISALMLINYALGLALEKFNAGRKQKVFLITGLFVNLGALIFFKYFSTYEFDDLLLATGWAAPAPLTDWMRGLIYPLGFSYITFQLIAYLMDVSRARVQAEHNPVQFALYVFYFPKIITGPITRYQQFLAERNAASFSYENIANGLRRFALGLFKKALIADQLGRVTAAAFHLQTPDFSTGVAWFVLIAYALQIYFDFSGYADMALGLAQTMGIRLPENFNNPYWAVSVSDFWRRWHMTLAAWFREYVFYPLERKRLPFAGQQINILIVFLLTGLWHGLTLPFVLWGLVHGLALALESTAFGRGLRSAWKPIQHFYTLGVVLIGWVFFRSRGPLFAIGFLARLIGDQTGLSPLPFSETRPLPFIDPTVWIALVIGLMLLLPYDRLWKRLSAFVEKRPAMAMILPILRDTLLVILFWASVAALIGGEYAPGIYANF
jgi:alginate O-acetyltransferase complex protein AlgI